MTTPDPNSDIDIESLASHLPGYRVEYFIAAGGMGAVYQARQISLDRVVALKVLPRSLGADLEFRKSFQTEARAMARLNHPNLIAVYDSGEVDGMPYIVMEYVDGCSLFHSANGRAIDPMQAVGIVLAILEGLAHAHAAGIVHRDVKPANVLLNKDAIPKLGDFGLARPIDQSGTGLCMGTPGYTAPEVMADPRHADKRSDLYAAGVILYELLTGQLPGACAVPPSAVVKVDAEMDRIWAKATHGDPKLRYPDAESLSADLIKWRKSQEKRPHGSIPPPARGLVRIQPQDRPRTPVQRAKSQGSMVTAVKVAINLALLVALYFAWKAYEYRKNHPQVVIVRESERNGSAKEEKLMPQAGTDESAGSLRPNEAADVPPSAVTDEKAQGSSDAPDMAALGASSFPVGLWHNRRVPQMIVTIRANGSCVTTMGHSGTWTWTGDSQAKTLRLEWTSGTIDTFPAAGERKTLEGANQSGHAVILDKMPDVADVPLETFLGDWIGSPDATSLWRIHPDGKVSLFNFKTSARMGEHTESKHTWERGPGGERITVFWDGNRRWFNVLTLMDDRRNIGAFNQRGNTYTLMRVPEGNHDVGAAGAALMGSGQKTRVQDAEYWRNKAREDFPALRDPNSKMSAKFLGFKKDKESLAPSFFKNANWPYQLAWDTALFMNDANPKYVDPKTPLFRGRFYKVFLQKCTWHEALARCRAMKGRLVTIPDQQTQDFVAKLAGGKTLWLGVTDEIQEGRWVWSDGSEMTFRNIGKGEGNGNRGRDEDYLFIANDGKWGDDSTNGDQDGFICEWWKANE